MCRKGGPVGHGGAKRRGEGYDCGVVARVDAEARLLALIGAGEEALEVGCKHLQEGTTSCKGGWRGEENG